MNNTNVSAIDSRNVYRRKRQNRMNNTNVGDISVLPEECLAKILSLTSPADAARLSAVSPTFRSAAESDEVWEKFLPSDYRSVVSESSDPFLITRSSSKKHLVLSLSHTPILIQAGRKSFWLEKWSGKKCYMISARDLYITWRDAPDYWQWITHPDSRFNEVAMLRAVCWLYIYGKIGTDKLSPRTHYTCYLVFTRTSDFHGFHGQAIDVSVGLAGSEGEKQTVYLEEFRGNSEDEKFPRTREDGWLEVELGKFFNDDSECGELEMSLSEVRVLYWKHGIVIQGIELRPEESHLMRHAMEIG